MIGKLQYNFFASKMLKPKGWLKKQLELQAQGLFGNLDKVWPDIKDSAWIGGEREGWERVPYWLDGFIPMAYLLNDSDMINRVEKYINSILERQAEDGWICPCSTDERGSYDTWAVLLISKVLVLYADCSGNESLIVDSLTRCFRQFSQHLDAFSLRNWGAARWFEGLIAIYWLYERTNESWLITLAKKLEIQGFNWKQVFCDDYLDNFNTGWDYLSHVVNIAMMLKSDALMSRISGGNAEALANTALDYLERKHSMAAGHFTGDECLSGYSPIHGSELCGIVEAMYSYEILFSITGNPKWLDKLETLAFNALPAAISPDMWTHQYDQLTNQVACISTQNSLFRTNSNDAHIFGLQPNYGCCTANFGQGWSKLALTTFMRSIKGIAACTLAPSSLHTEINGVNVLCELQTEYPFRNNLTFIIKTEKPVNFEFSFRVPACAKKAFSNGNEVQPGAFAKIEKTWEGEEHVSVALEFDFELKQRPNDLYSLWHGPLLYSVKIEEQWEKVEYVKDNVPRKFPYCDYRITPVSDWNYAFYGKNFSITENSYTQPFSPDCPPVHVIADMVPILWEYIDGHCAELPKSREPLGDVSKIKMIPYGCTNLRMTEMPLI